MEIVIFDIATGRIMDKVSVSSAEVADQQAQAGQGWVVDDYYLTVTPAVHWVENPSTDPNISTRPWNVTGFDDGPAPIVLDIEDRPAGTYVRARPENLPEDDPASWVEAQQGEEPITLMNAGRFITEVIAPFPERVIRQVTEAT